MATKVFESESLLSFAVPKGTKCIQDSDEMIEVMTKDEQFGVVALPFDMESTETDDLSQLIVDLAEEAGVDLNDCDRLSIENDDIVGQVFTVNQDEVIYVFGLCGNDERGYAFQITATEDYEDDVMSVLETISIEDDEEGYDDDEDSEDEDYEDEEGSDDEDYEDEEDSDEEDYEDEEDCEDCSCEDCDCEDSDEDEEENCCCKRRR